MKCSCCGEVLVRGYFYNSTQPIQWIPQDKEPAFWKGGVAKDAIRLGNGSLLDWDGYRADAYFCKRCQMIIVPLVSDVK